MLPFYSKGTMDTLGRTNILIIIGTKVSILYITSLFGFTAIFFC